MPKRRPSLDPRQEAFSFDLPKPANHPADLAGLDKVIAAGVAHMLKDDPRSREEIAGAMSSLLADPVSKWMLDAYASEARDDHNIPAAKLLALTVATDSFDILDMIVTRCGARVFAGAEVDAALVGHLEAQKRDIDRRLRAAKARSQPIERGARGR